MDLIPVGEGLKKCSRLLVLKLECASRCLGKPHMAGLHSEFRSVGLDEGGNVHSSPTPQVMQVGPALAGALL